MANLNKQQVITVVHAKGGNTVYRGTAYSFECMGGYVDILLAGVVVASYDSDTLENVLIK